MATALAGLIAADDGPREEDGRVFAALCTHFLGAAPAPDSITEPIRPEELAAHLADETSRGRLVQMAIVLELCRHPASDRQVQLVEEYGSTTWRRRG